MQKTWRLKQRLIQMDLKALDAFSLERVEKGQLYEVYNHYLHYYVCVCNRTRITVMPTPVSLQTWMDLKLILHRIITISGKRSLVIWSSFKQLFLMCCQFNNVSFTPLYKGVKTKRMARLNNNFQAWKLCWNCSASKVHLEFLNNFHILEILES